LFVIVDVRRRLGDYDRQMLEFAAAVGRPAAILLAKADKLKRGQAAGALAEVRRETGEGVMVELFSAVTRQGVEEARAALDRMLRA
jgi:GTP-binding protein